MLWAALRCEPVRSGPDTNNSKVGGVTHGADNSSRRSLLAVPSIYRSFQRDGRAVFSQPITAAVAPSGAIYVGSRGATPWGWNKYVRITKTNSDHDFIGDFGRGGEGSGEFVWLTSVALDADENVYAADEWLNRITVFDSEGKLLKTWGEPPHDVERLNWDPAEPASAQKISLRDEAPSYQEGKLNGPSGLAFDLEGNLLLANSLDSRIQKFTKDGEYISSFGVKGDGPGELDMPWGITVDNNGDIYVADWNNHRVQKFSPDGEHLLTFGSEKRTGVSPDGSTPYEHVLSARVPVNPNDLNHPTDVAVDGDGDVYVAGLDEQPRGYFRRRHQAHIGDQGRRSWLGGHGPSARCR